MPKYETLKIQETLLKLGKKLGFTAKIEEKLDIKSGYEPIYDAVWYLDLKPYVNFEALTPLFVNDYKLLDRMKMLPFAGFEIEGSTTTTKNQIGNFANLHAGKFLFNFEIVNNVAAGKENDTYRRGLKIYRYFNQIQSMRNDFFLDRCHLYESISQLPKSFNTEITVCKSSSSKRGTYGGEKEDCKKMFDEIFPMLCKSGLSIYQNREPDICKLRYFALKQVFSDSISDYGRHYISQSYYADPVSLNEKNSKNAKESLYIPKMDIEAGFNMPESFFIWLKALGKAMKNDAVNYPLIFGIINNRIKEYFISLIAIEIENSINKHLNGGICNMSSFSHTGILVTNQSADSHIKYMRNELGINNVTYYQCGGKK